MHFQRKATSVGLLCAALTSVGDLYASGFAAARFGGELGGVTSTNPTALYYNPAGIGFSTGASLYADGTIAFRHFSWDHPRNTALDPVTGAPLDGTDPPGGEGANAGKAEIMNVFGGPMLGATARLGSLAFGAALTVPFGGRAFFGKNDKFVNSPFPLAADGVQRWHITEGATTSIYATLGAAYRLGPVSIGVAGNLVNSTFKNTQAKDFGGDGRPNTEREGRDVLDVKGWNGSYGVGAMVEVVPERLWLAGSYQAQPGLGPMQLKGTVTLSDPASGNSRELPVTFDTALPDIIRAGARWRTSETFELRLMGDVTRWSVLHTQCVAIEGHPCVIDATGRDAGDGGTVQNIRRYWKDTYGVHVSASYWIRPELELFSGVAFETAANPDETLRPDLPDADNFAIALGGRYEIVKSFLVAATYTHIQYLNRDNTGKSQLAQAAPPTTWPDGGGKYTQWIGVFNFNVEKRF
jgi:long-chain fatty acid transport protein